MRLAKFLMISTVILRWALIFNTITLRNTSPLYIGLMWWGSIVELLVFLALFRMPNEERFNSEKLVNNGDFAFVLVFVPIINTLATYMIIFAGLCKNQYGFNCGRSPLIARKINPKIFIYLPFSLVLLAFFL